MFYDEEERWVACVHEAAHAVIASLGGAGVYEIAVASVGSGEWDGDYDEYDKIRKPSCTEQAIAKRPMLAWRSGFSRWDSDENLYRVTPARIFQAPARAFFSTREG